MPDGKPQFITVGEGPSQREIAVRNRPGRGPMLVWLGGFRSDMVATKATALDHWAAEHGRACLRFDYSGNGESGGVFEEATLSRWLEESLAVIDRFGRDPMILVGSSMGGWLALLAARARAAAGKPPFAGLVLIAPAADFTERLIWDKFPDAVRREIMEKGRWHAPSAYGEPYPITRALIEDGRNHLLFDQPITPGAPVHILQGMEDPDVPWQHAMLLMEHLPGDEAIITFIKDGDHRLSRPQDIARLLATIADIAPEQQTLCPYPQTPSCLA
jgi:pimeloyl-ACP methyl ester carboxylesterase